MKQKKWNHYQCPECGGVTIARHDDEGTTPFMIRCRARDTSTPDKEGGFHRVSVCKGMAQSSFFRGSQDDNQVPHVIFYRPSIEQAILDINKGRLEHRDAMWVHYQQGGSLMREV